MSEPTEQDHIRAVFELCKAELDAQLESIDSLDTKGSILVGSGAALLSLSYLILKDATFVWFAFPCFAAATVLGIMGVWVRTWHRVPSPERLKDDFQRGIDITQSYQESVEYICEAFQGNSTGIKRKSRFIKAGLLCITAGAVWICFSLALRAALLILARVLRSVGV